MAILRRCGLLSLSMTMAKVEPPALVSTALCGMTSAFGTVFAIISTLTLEPGLSFPSRLSASTHTSTVVLAGSSAALISVTFAAIGTPPGPMRLASLPTASSAASDGGRWARAITRDTSMTVTTGAPLCAVSPG